MERREKERNRERERASRSATKVNETMNFSISTSKKMSTKKKTSRGNVFARETTTSSRAEDEREADETNERSRMFPIASSSSRVGRREKKIVEDALEEDPSVFDFDGWKGTARGQQSHRRNGKRRYGVVYDGSGNGEKKKSKYIGHLLKKAKMRQREQDIVFEKKKQKELEREIEELGDTEKFVTSAYKKKLKEDEKWMQEQKRKEDEADRVDAKEGRDMSGFYRNLFTRNTAFGQIVADDDGASNERPNKRAESQRRQTRPDDDTDPWIRKESRSRPGEFYWKNASTGETSWERPTRPRDRDEDRPPRRATRMTTTVREKKRRRTTSAASSNDSSERRNVGKRESVLSKESTERKEEQALRSSPSSSAPDLTKRTTTEQRIEAARARALARRMKRNGK